jgi:hypothetical protein
MLLAEALRAAAATRRGPAGRPSSCAGWASHSPRVADPAWLNVLPRLLKSTSIAGLDLVSMFHRLTLPLSRGRGAESADVAADPAQRRARCPGSSGENNRASRGPKPGFP